MYCIIKGHNFEHELQTIGQIFYQNQGFCLVDDIPADGICLSSLLENGLLINILHSGGAQIALSERKISGNPDKKELGFIVKTSMFELIRNTLNKSTPWGSLTGIRPTKIMHELINGDYTEDRAIRHMQEKYHVSESKAELLAEIVNVQQKVLSTHENDKNYVNLYIGIPFCPTRCHYCSFAAYPMDKYGKYTDDYVNALLREMHGAKKDLANKKIRTVYIGGGTPTALSEEQLEKLLYNIQDIFCIGDISEYSVEAGRPDTITLGKLETLKKYEVSRISINTQTLKQETLLKIGRNHTTEQFFDAFNMARAAGFDFINVDLMAGLPGESISDFKETIEQICRLSPENLTIHTLAVKRASKFKEDIIDKGATFESNEISDMLDIAYEYAKNEQMQPYYLYRQKNMVDLFENVGYAKKGFECIYNIHIMEETETVIALGAGAITKYVYPLENRIERSANIKDVVGYIRKYEGAQ